MGLIARARSLSRPGPSRDGGLLRRMQTLLQADRTEDRKPPEKPTPQEFSAIADADELLYRLSQISEGVGAPALLFSLLKEHLKLRSAALLLLDASRQLYVPWCAVGLDTTTRHRLLLPPGANAAFDRAAAGQVVLAEGEELQGFKEFFSSREFALIQRLVLAPFVHLHRLLGLLLIVRLAMEPTQELVSLLQQAVRQASPLLHRLAGRSAEELPAERGLSLPELVQTSIQTAKQRSHPLVLMRIDLDPILRRAASRFPELETFRLQEELANLCRAMFQVIGRVRAIQKRSLLVVVHGMKEADPELLRRQLLAVFGGYLRELLGTEDLELDMESRVIGDEPEAALRFIGESP